MINSHSQQFVFIKTRKTAGSSVEIGLSRVCGTQDIITPLITELGEEELRQNEGGIGPFNHKKTLAEHRGFREWRKLLLRGKRGERYSQHMTAAEIRNLLGEDLWSRYYTFTVERNPWDRALSRYWWQKYRWEVRRGRTNFPDISEYLRYLEHHKPHYLSNWGHYTINNEIAVDRVLFYENLSLELEQVKREIGLSGDISLPQKKAKSGFRGDQGHYSEILSPDDRELIRRICHHEIERFGYEF